MAKHNLQELDSGQLDMMWRFMQLGGIEASKHDVEALIKHTDALRQAMVQKTGGQEKYSPEEYIPLEDIGTYVNLIAVECLALRASGALEKMLTMDALFEGDEDG